MIFFRLLSSLSFLIFPFLYLLFSSFPFTTSCVAFSSLPLLFLLKTSSLPFFSFYFLFFLILSLFTSPSVPFSSLSPLFSFLYFLFSSFLFTFLFMSSYFLPFSSWLNIITLQHETSFYRRKKKKKKRNRMMMRRRKKSPHYTFVNRPCNTPSNKSLIYFSYRFSF